VNTLAFKVTTLRLPKETVKTLEDLAKVLKREKSDVMREALQIGVREMRIRLALDLYSEGKISFGRMAELTSLGYRELFLELKRRNATLRYGEERFSEEVKQLVD
jgi:predicted HTH domain antitoxin